MNERVTMLEERISKIEEVRDSMQAGPMTQRMNDHLVMLYQASALERIADRLERWTAP